MVLRLARSFNKLSSWISRPVNAMKRGREPSNTSLIYILLAPGQSENRYSAHVTLLADKLMSIDVIQSVVLLENIRLSSGLPLTASTLDSRSAAHALLVTVDTDSLPATVRQARGILHPYDTGSHHSIFVWSLNVYAQIQIFQPLNSQGRSGTCLVTVLIKPASGQADDIDAWYRKELLQKLGATAPHLFLRCNRYLLSNDPSKDEANEGNAEVDCLAVHEYTSMKTLLQHSIHKGPVVEETEWGNRILYGANQVHKTIWEVRASFDKRI